MRFKKGFTLAEILIVLMVIGALATMTLPSLIKGVQEAQFKTAYKKAVNAVANLTAVEKIAGNLPSRTGSDAVNVNRVWDSFVSSLSVKGFVASAGEGTKVGLGSGTVLDMSGETNPISSTTPTGDKRYQNWIITEDNLAYLILKGKTDNKDDCGTKMQITETQAGVKGESGSDSGNDTGTTNQAKLAANSCFVVYVDVNGLTSAPNTVAPTASADTEGGEGATGVGNNYVPYNMKIPTLTYDTYPIYIGSDGSTPGSPRTTVTGRIGSDLK